jgi:hypothetical protein
LTATGLVQPVILKLAELFCENDENEKRENAININAFIK